jgi:hypothetical protein
MTASQRAVGPLVNTPSSESIVMARSWYGREELVGDAVGIANAGNAMRLGGLAYAVAPDVAVLIAARCR